MTINYYIFTIIKHEWYFFQTQGTQSNQAESTDPQFDAVHRSGQGEPKVLVFF